MKCNTIKVCNHTSPSSEEIPAAAPMEIHENDAEGDIATSEAGKKKVQYYKKKPILKDIQVQ